MATRKAGTIRIDFREETEGGGRVRVPEGDYKVRVAGVKPDTSKDGNPMLVWSFEGLEGKLKGKKLTDYTSLTPKALWKVRSILEALGVDAPSKSVFELPTKKVMGKELGVTIGDDEYNGRISSKIQDYLDLETLNSSGDEDDEDEEDEDDEEVEEDDDDEEEDEDDDDGLDELDRAELKAHIKKNKLDIAIKKSMSDDDIRAAIRDADDDEDDDDDEIGSLDLEDNDL